MLYFKTQGNYVVCNELPSGTVGWVVARGTVGLGSFVVQIRKVLFFYFFSKFLSLVSFFYFRVRLSVRLRVKVRVSFRVRFCLSDVLRWAKISLAHSLDPGVNI